MEERIKFAVRAARGAEVFSDLCEEFGISRKIGYKWLKRYKQLGMAGTKELSRRPRSSPNRTERWIEQWIVKERRAHQRWGPKKLIWALGSKHDVTEPPAISTVAKILNRRGLSGRRGRRRRQGEVVRLNGAGLTKPTRPNQVWTADFKGWFKTQDGFRCDPLTVTDLFSHYVLAVKAVPQASYRCARRAFKALFRLYGLPEVIRVDNGPPFGSAGLAGLSKLNIWWIKLGIRVEHIRPASPQLNGSHERMHRELKADTTQPASKNRRAQQRRFDRWKRYFNHGRPHEAIGMRKPADLYQPSARLYSQADKTFRYPEGFLTKEISETGFLWYSGERYYLGEAFGNHTVSLKRNGPQQIEVYLAKQLLGTLGTQIQGRFRPTASIVPVSAPRSA